ncbi:MAG: T9SS type A sorting domain-containing protein [Candidatus Marinimicrobia bacterium]|nr:T9SS type A sorting domain-containing protein [Candidatus Neomarinimicrobiota bacterium]
MRTRNFLLCLSLLVTTSVRAQNFTLNISNLAAVYTVPVDTSFQRLYLLQEMLGSDWTDSPGSLEITFHNTAPSPITYTFAGLMQVNLGTELVDTLAFQITPHSSQDSVETGQFSTPNGLVPGFRYIDFPGDSVSGVTLDFTLDTLAFDEQYLFIWYRADTLSDWSPFQPMALGNIWKYTGAFPAYSRERLEVIDTTTSGDTTIYTVSRQREFSEGYGEGVVTDTGKVFTRSSARYSVGYYSDAYLDLLICSFQSVMPPDNIWTLEGIFPYSDGSLDYGVVLMMGGAGFRRYGVGFHLFIGDNIGTVSRLIGYRVGDEVWGDIDVITGIQEEPQTPRDFSINVYPNPFNPITMIRYGLPQSDQVTVAIFDALGRRVAVLVDQEMTSAGIHRKIWNATEEASGIYFIQIASQTQTRVQKVLLVK